MAERAEQRVPLTEAIDPCEIPPSRDDAVMPDPEYRDTFLQLDDPGPVNPVFEGAPVLSWLDAGLLEDLRDRSDIVAPIQDRKGTPFIHEDGRFRSLHFNIFHLQSEMDVRNPLRLTVDYTRMMMGFLLFHTAPRRIEMIGLGGGSLAKYCHHILPATDLCVVEIDPDVIALRDRFLIPADSNRFRVIEGDGADFVQRDLSRPDILLVDGFDRRGQSPQLCTPAFYRACRRRLAPGGMMVVNLSGPHAQKATITNRIHDIFKGKTLSIITEGGANRAIFACRSRRPELTAGQLDVALERLGMDQSSFLTTIGRRILRHQKRNQRKSAHSRTPASGTVGQQSAEIHE